VITWALARRARQAHAPRARDHHAQRPRARAARYLARGWRGEPATSTVASADLPFEFMMNALRLNQGFEPAQFEARTGLAWAEIVPRVQRLAARGLLTGEAGAGGPRSLEGDFSTI